MKIPFDIKFKPQIESGEYKVETKDGRKVRIISWDKSGFECTEIVALVKCATGTDNCNIYTIDGLLRSNCYQDNMKLVVITPEPELNEWQTFISGCLQKYGLLDCGAADRIAKECSVDLLDLARKELIEEQYTSDPRKTDLYKLGKAEALKDIEQDPESSYAFKRGVEYGKEEALKDLPRWRHSLPERGRRYVILFNNGRIVESYDFRKDGRFYYEDGELYQDVPYDAINWMYVEDLLKLQKED